MGLQFLIEIDLSAADLILFDRYEDLALGVLASHGGRLMARVRDVEERREWHLIHVPDRAAWERFRADPLRLEHTWLLERSKVAVQRHEVWTVE